MAGEYEKLPLSRLGRLDGDVAVVTGAAQGFGYAIAERLAEAGAAVALADVNEAGARAAASRIEAWAGEDAALLPVQADVTDPASVESLFATVEDRLGPVGLLVNNAGVYSNYRFVELPVAEFDRIQRVNLRGVFLCSQRAARAMSRRGGGRIIHIASVDALGSSAEGLVHYTTSKHGLAGMTKAMAMELGPAGIRVNAVCPGASYTEGTYTLLAEGAPQGIDVEQQWAGIVARTPLGRLIDPDEIGLAVVAVAGPMFQSMHGCLVVIDGGIVVQPLEGYVFAGSDGE